jgi:HAMP domain-containing protein/signal transduction histidine kinase/DNA-binding response OmpR family regulator
MKKPEANRPSSKSTIPPASAAENDPRDQQMRAMLLALSDFKDGDFTVRLPQDWTGIAGKAADAFNELISRNQLLAAELDRISVVVGQEGRISQRASLGFAKGCWEEAIRSVNELVANLVQPTSEMARVIGAVAKGDLSQTISVEMEGRPLRGEFLKTARTVNTMVEQLGGFASEVTRVAREVGTEGKLGGQAKVKGVAGTWKDLTDNVNLMAGNLTAQVRNIATVTTAVANGDLTKKITVDVKGEFLELKDTVNTMVGQLRSFASEVTRVAREVGTEGALGGQARVEGVAGTWKDLTDSVNSMAGNLTDQVRNIAEVTTAVANGDLSKKITVDVKGEILELKDTINTMVDQLRSFASEVSRVAREVGTEGRLGGQAEVSGVAGTWKDLTDNVNMMAGNLTDQVRNIAAVTTAIAQGDLSKKITVDVKGEILQMKNTINTMVDQLSSFADEVTRVAREVGTEGNLGGQAKVKGVAGTWKDLTDSVNSMAGNLTSQVRNIADVTKAVAAGNLSKKITVDVRGEILELKDTINTMVDQLRSFASEVTRVAREVGSEGALGGQARVEGVSGTWKDLTDSVNFMASNLTTQVRNIAAVTTAVANGDLSKKITVDVKGEILELKDTVNTMVDQLNSFASEVTRVAREVGTEGKLGGQADVPGVAGTWKDLTDSVNSMAGNLTNQVRGIAKVVTAVAKGDLKQKLMVEAKGEIAELADTINSMTSTLAVFAEQVTSVAREVGVEGELGGQAHVPGASGTWRDLTDNVNQLAANLTTQLRAIADVATAVTKGDLTQTIQVSARGEVAFVKDNINEMIRNLKDTTTMNKEQDWLKTNLAKFTRMLQGQKDMLTVGQLILSELAPVVSAQHGVFYIVDGASGEPGEQELRLLASYAYSERKNVSNRYALGEGLVGQAALEKQPILLTNVPHDYVRISSGLGEAPPVNIMVLPVLFEGYVKAVIELASFERFSKTHETFLAQLAESIGIVLNTIKASTLTENLLRQSQSLAGELQSRQEELQKTNEELQEKAAQLAEQNAEVERKNREVEQARLALEGKARQLSLTSKYKSEFLANMSHELRTPLNSLLILADQLGSNPQGNLTPKQVEFARTIHGSGRDLLRLINDILDLSKIESGNFTVTVSDVALLDLTENLERTFRHVAQDKGLEMIFELERDLPDTIATDEQRLDQVLKNLISNAIKFTERGRVTFSISVADAGWSKDRASLNNASCVLAFAISDTGIGIPEDKQMAIFEAFQQADGSTSRRYGGTGLGLAISRELARLLGGEIQVRSQERRGSTFILYLPQRSSNSRPVKIAPAPALSDEPVPDIDHLPLPMETAFPDDRQNIAPGDKVVLIIEDDKYFAQLLLDAAHSQGFKGLTTSRGYTALNLAREFDLVGITLDVSLPDINGWKVLSRLKSELTTRHIPVFVVSVDAEPENALKQGALSFISKPLEQSQVEDLFRRIRHLSEESVRTVLVVEDDESQRESIKELIGNGSARVVLASSGEEALHLVEETPFACVVVDLMLPDISGFELIRKLRAGNKDLPIIVYTGKDLTGDEEAELARLTQTVIVKDVRSPERLYDQTALWLHRKVSEISSGNRELLSRLNDPNKVLAGKRVLLVDDDIRNIFAMTSLLERYNMEVISSESGRKAMEILDSGTNVEIVLMDIMMPEMDGYQTMRTIRNNFGFRELPIIALTAKAMKGDREKCIEAGASDYISKPVDPDRLLTLLRTWLYR